MLFGPLMSISGEDTGMKLCLPDHLRTRGRKLGVANRHNQAKMRRIKPTVVNKYHSLWKMQVLYGLSELPCGKYNRKADEAMYLVLVNDFNPKVSNQ